MGQTDFIGHTGDALYAANGAGMPIEVIGLICGRFRSKGSESMALD
jgi:hypothetical protein